jgi:predicted ATPase/DNA-binding SARP family transcriptional activator
MAHLSLALLGPLQVSLDGAPVTAFESDKVRALLAYLVLEADRSHRRAALAGLLWPERPERAAHLSLNQALANLRHAIGDRAATAPVLRITPESIQWNTASDSDLDVTAFSDLLAACAQHPHRHPETCTACAKRLHQAAALYRGSLLDQFFLSDNAAFEEWALLTRERLHRRAIAALVQLAEYHEGRREYEQAQQHTWRLLELDPWREASHRQLMRLLALSGQRSAALAQYVTCRRVLADELGVEPEPETTALYARIQRGEVVPAVRPLPTTNLAAHTPPTRLIGRATELTQIADRLEQRDCRLLTLVGPGGVGKTRLALQVGADLSASYRDGVYFVPLAPLNSAELLVPAIAGALALALFGPADPKAQLLAHLHAKDMLLVLDNFEHLLVMAPLVSELLAACPDLTMLATSRAPLHIQSEQQFPVPPLRLPNRDQLPDVATLAQYSAVSLFVARAQAVLPSFALTDSNASVVAEICCRLDGLPLAIELAAARSKLLPPESLLARLSRRLTLLTGGAHDLPARQQTLRAAIAWSYELLNPDAQALFARLAVFVGGCTLEAVEAVCNASGDLPLDVLDELALLVDNCLLRREEGAEGEPRLLMLETIREYALERLAARGEAEQVRGRFLTFYRALAEDTESKLKGSEQGVWLERLEREHDNMRAALAWALEGGDIEIGVRLAGALWPFWWVRGYGSEGRKWLKEALRLRGDVAPAIRARLLLVGGSASVHDNREQASGLGAEALALFRDLDDAAGIAWSLLNMGDMAWRQGNYARAILLCTEGLARFRELGDQRGIAFALHKVGDIVRDQGDPARAGDLLEESLSIWRKIGNQDACGWVLNGLGDVALYQGDYELASARYQESLVLFQEMGSRDGIAWMRRNLGRVAHLQGDDARAATMLGESVAWFREVRDEFALSWAIHHLGIVAYACGDVTQAVALLREALILQQKQGHTAQIAESLEACARMAVAQGRAAWAARVLGAVEMLRTLISASLSPSERVVYQRSIAAARAQLEDATFAAAWAAGQAMTLEQAIAEALGELTG